MTEEEFLKPLPITNEDHVYRQVHWSALQKSDSNKKKKFPNASHFTPDADGLSVNLAKLITLNGVYHIIGISFKPNTTEFKSYKDFKVFRFSFSFLRSIENIKSVLHSPVLNGNPAPVGNPNNYAHASVLYGEDDEDVRLKLSTYCDSNYEQALCTADFTSIDKEVAELRERLNDTPYHRF